MIGALEVTGGDKGSLPFSILCSGLCAAITLALPPYYPLLQPDSAGYLAFDSSRTAFYPLFLRALEGGGLNPNQITYLQFGIFHIALVFLLLALLRANCRKSYLVLFSAALGANIGFSSVHWTILTESIYLSLSLLMLSFLLDYLRTGSIRFAAATALMIGLLYGIRPSAITLVPMLFIVLRLKWHKRDHRSWILLSIVAASLAVGPILEAIAFRVEHGNNRSSIVPNIMMGKAAMVIRNDTKFSGPNAETLNKLGAELSSLYGPVHEFIAHVPSIIAWPVVSSNYEAVAQFSILNDAIALASSRTGLSQAALQNELGLQAVEENFGRYLKLSLLNYFGQWSVTALTFPPASRAFNYYVEQYPDIPLRRYLSEVTLHPPASRLSYLIYPAFLAAGMLSLIVGIGLLIFLWRPKLAEQGRYFNLMVAATLGAMCQANSIIISLVNVATPRFLMAVYPQIVLMVIFLLMVGFPVRRCNIGSTKLAG